MKNWLEELKVGDTVIVSPVGSMRNDSIHKIDRLTKTQIVVDDSRFRRSDGSLKVGGSIWYSSLLEEASLEAVKRIREDQRRERLLDKIIYVEWKTLKTDELEKVFNALPDHSK